MTDNILSFMRSFLSPERLELPGISVIMGKEDRKEQRKAVLQTKMRLFIAIQLSADMKKALTGAQKVMYDQGVRGNFTTEENMHLTLAFIGEYPDADRALDALAMVRFTPFEITPEGVGCFGDLWWAGVRDPAPLAAVARRVRRALAESEIPFDRKRFSPHITLIRKASRAAEGIQLPPATMTVDALSLMRSDRGRKGMIYTAIGVREATQE